MESVTYNKIKYEKREDNAVVVVSGNKTWYTYLGDLPLEKHSEPLLDTVNKLKAENKQLKSRQTSLENKVKTLNDVLIGILEDIKKEKESDGL